MQQAMRSGLWAGLVSVVVSGPVLGAPPVPGQPYVGVGAGWANAVTDYDEINQQLRGAGFAGGVRDDDQAGALRVFVGWPMNERMALEASWFDLGRFDWNAGLSGGSSLQGHTGVRGVGLDALWAWPLADRLQALARLGVVYTRQEYGAEGGGALALSRHGHDHDWNPKLGLGVQYALTPRLAARAEWDHYRLRHDDLPRMPVNAWMLSLAWSFGPAAPAAAAPAVMTEPVAPVAEPAPASAPAPLKSSSFSEQSLFAFDSAQLQPEGRANLQQLAREVQAMEYAQVTVIGHASPPGTDEYNMRLSQQRAQAVRDELVAGGVDAARIRVEARGESEPVTAPGECRGNEKTDAAAQECHQPDRRVRVEVTAAATPATAAP